MDDPWAAPSWSTPAKPSASTSKPFSLSPPRSATPTANFDDVSDPWGAPSSLKLPAGGADARGTGVHVAGDEGTPLGGVLQPQPEPMPSWGGDVNGGWGGAPSGTSGAAQQLSMAMPSSPTISSPRRSREHEHDPNPLWGGEVDLGGYEAGTSTKRVSFESPSSPSALDANLRAYTPPPRSLSALPDLSSPGGSFHSPRSHRSMTPVIAPPTQEDDPEAAFAAALTGKVADDMPTFDIPKSPSFGDGDFGGFSIGGGDDAWGGKADWGGGGAAEADRGFDDDQAGAEATEGGWGSGRVVKADESRPSGSETDWAHAQEKIRIQQQLAPQDKVERLRSGWREVAGAVIGLRKLPDPSPEEVSATEDVLRRMDDERETLQALSIIPSNINTYPPVLSSFTTYTTYTTALQRPNPSPSTSLLISSSTRRPAWTDRAGESSSHPWLSRSRLGEAEVPVQEPAVQETEQKKGWSFWGRKAAVEKPLVTSGGGILEVKTSSPIAPSQAPTSATRTSLGDRPASSTSNRPSRPESPASSKPHVPDQHSGPDLLSSDATSQAMSPSVAAAAPAPSAVSRFFGRLRRNPSAADAAPTTVFDADAHDAKDLELGEDDFSFLNQVPSMAPRDKTQSDLLGIESGRGEDMASLESMIASKPVPLPAPLAPPPRSVAPAYRGASVSRPSRSTEPQKASDMDLLSDLFNGDGEQTVMSPSSTTQDSHLTSPVSRGNPESAPIGWDDFMVPSKPSSSTIGSATEMLSPSALASPAKPAVPPKSSAGGDTFGDFDDFGTPLKASTATFDDNDDFDDFTSFGSGPPPASTALQTHPPAHRTSSSNTSASPVPLPSSTAMPFLSTPAERKPRLSLDHTPTINLLNDVSGSKGKRWPAPPSPHIPVLAPPSTFFLQQGTTPKVPPPPGPFPFLSPPPPPRPASGSSSNGRVDLFGDTNGEAAEMASASMSPQTSGGQQGLSSPVGMASAMSNFSGLAPAPARQSPAPNALAGQKPAVSVQNGGSRGGKGALSAQDLSFFDNL